MESDNRPQILIVGAYHMDNPNLDAVKTDFGDVLAAPAQRQIQAVVEGLKRFAPTHVAIEVEPARMDRIQQQYRQYRAGQYTLGRNEVDQIAYRLADQLGHERLYGIDHKQDLNMDAVFRYIEEHGMTDLAATGQAFMAEMQATTKRIETEEGVAGLLRHMNTPAFDANHQIYLRLVPVGAADTWVGADMVAAWYARNLKIYANIVGLARRPEDRILVVIGSGHGALLRQFLRETPGLELVDTLQYLP